MRKCFSWVAPILALSICSTPLLAEDILEEVIVISSRTEMPLRQVGTAVSIIDADDIKLRGYTQLSELLRTQPSINVSNSGGVGKVTAVRIRGEEAFRTRMLIDGVELTDPTSPQAAPLPQLVTTGNNIQRVEILRGPQGLIYGADAGGVISVSTYAPTQGTTAKISGEYGRYDSRALDAFYAAGSKIGSVSLAVSEHKTNGFNATMGDTTNERDGNKNTTIHGKIRLNINDAISTQLVLRDIDAESQFDSFGVADAFSLSEQSIARLSVDTRVYSFEGTTSFSYTDIERASITGGQFPFTFISEGYLQKLETVWDYSSHDSFGALIGAELREELLEGDTDVDRSQKSLFAELRGTPVTPWTLTGGLRIDDNDTYGTHTSLRATTAYLLSLQSGDSIKFRSSIGTGFRAPSLSEITFNTGPFAVGDAIGNELEEETSEGIDVGYDYYFSDVGVIKLTAFYQKIEDQIVFIFASGVTSGYFQDDGTSSSRGVEIETQYSWSDHALMYANFTYNKTRDAEGQPRIRRPIRTANVGGKFGLFDNKLNLVVNVRSARNAVDVGGIALDNYAVVDLSARYTVSASLDISVRVENAGDREYVEISGFNTAGAGVYGGFTLSL